jgi:ketosteroid isomerase-like protein
MIERWMQWYLKAWVSDNPGEVAALFAQDARYYTEPYAEPWVGRDEIVRQWIKRGDSSAEWSFEHEVVAEEGDIAVIRGVTRYADEPGGGGAKTYHNVWVVRFAPDGTAREFTEWWMEEE